MTLRSGSLVVIAAVAFGSARVDAKSSSVQRNDSGRVRATVLRVSDLRSAYLVRSGQVRYETSNTTVAGNRAQLQRHFDTVLGLLLLATPQSIDTALARLEETEDHKWPADERAAWRTKLQQNRRLQMARLAAYRNRGLFPLNEDHGTALPIFVDKHDTACAVGHLMRLSSWSAQVASIELENNFVYVPDIKGGSIARWVLTSGLTIEEAALIQPAYDPPVTLASKPDDAIPILESTWSRVAGDLRFSNFQVRAVGSAPYTNISVRHGLCSWLCQLPDFDNATKVVVQFDVETTSPLQLLMSRPWAGPLATYVGEPLTYGRNQIGLFLADDQAGLFFDDSDIDEPGPMGYALSGTINVAPFEPTPRMTVVTELISFDGHTYEPQRLLFDVSAIPEPSALILFAIGCAAIGSRRRCDRV